MDSSKAPLISLTCPTCGAPLKLKIDEPIIQCQYCNATVVNPDYQPPQPARPEPVSYVRELPPRVVRPSKASRSRLWIVPFIVLIFVVMPLALILGHPFSSQGLFTLPQLQPVFPVQIVGSAIMLPGSSSAPAMLAVVRNQINDQYAIDRLDLNSHKSVWSVLGQSDYLQVDNLLAGDTYAYIVIKTQLIAIGLSDGKQAWKASLPDAIPGACKRCALVQNGQVILLTADGSLGVYDAVTGHQTWEKHLQNPGPTLYSVGDGVAVTDWADKGAFLSVMDAATGSEQITITPTCQPEGSLSDDMEVYSNVVIDSSTSPTKAYVFFGLFNACVQRWDLSSGKMDWETAEPDQNLDNSRDVPVLLNAGQLFYIQEDQLRSIDAATGQVHKLLEGVSDYTLDPLLVQGQRLLIRAKRTRGTTRFELWGYDLGSDKVLWKHPIPNSAPLDPPDEKDGLISSDETGFTYQVTPGGFWLITFQTQPNQVNLAQVNLDSGEWSDQKSLALGIPKDTDFFDVPERIASQDHLAWFVVNNDIYAIDADAGTFPIRWP